MKFLLFGIGLLLSLPTYGQWGVGLRLGDLTGVTVKKYLNTRGALELSLGRTRFFYNNWNYDDDFERWYKNKKHKHTSHAYSDYSQSGTVGLQAHYLWHSPIASIGGESTKGLQWYWGLGAQVHFLRYEYRYQYKQAGSNRYYFEERKAIDTDLGVDGVLGLEYTFAKTPLSLFLDITLSMELIDDPFYPWIQAGTGLRYNF